MKQLLLSLMLVLLAIMPLAGARKALVIGNSEYSFGALKNPVNDARLVEGTLEKLNFDVTGIYNADAVTIESSVQDFAKTINIGDEVFFYYSGHAVQIEGENYLIPVHEHITDVITAKRKSIPLKMVMEYMARASINIVVMDACRDNPFPSFRSLTKGLALFQSDVQNVHIVYSTSPGDVAEDGVGKNSIFTESLCRNMLKPNVSFDDVMTSVTGDLTKLTNNRQRPWHVSSADRSYVLNPQEVPKPQPVVEQPPKPAQKLYTEEELNRIADEKAAAKAAEFAKAKAAEQQQSEQDKSKQETEKPVTVVHNRPSRHMGAAPAVSPQSLAIDTQAISAFTPSFLNVWYGLNGAYNTGSPDYLNTEASYATWLRVDCHPNDVMQLRLFGEGMGLNTHETDFFDHFGVNLSLLSDSEFRTGLDLGYHNQYHAVAYEYAHKDYVYFADSYQDGIKEFHEAVLYSALKARYGNNSLALGMNFPLDFDTKFDLDYLVYPTNQFELSYRYSDLPEDDNQPVIFNTEAYTPLLLHPDHRYVYGIKANNTTYHYHSYTYMEGAWKNNYSSATGLKADACWRLSDKLQLQGKGGYYLDRNKIKATQLDTDSKCTYTYNYNNGFDQTNYFHLRQQQWETLAGAKLNWFYINTGRTNLYADVELSLYDSHLFPELGVNYVYRLGTTSLVSLQGGINRGGSDEDKFDLQPYIRVNFIARLY